MRYSQARRRESLRVAEGAAGVARGPLKAAGTASRIDFPFARFRGAGMEQRICQTYSAGVDWGRLGEYNGGLPDNWS